jgi:sodium-coupled neutral amino acid transporter 11
MAEGGSREHEEDPESKGLLSSSNDPEHANESHHIEQSPKGEAKINNPKKLTLATSPFEPPQPRRTSSFRPAGTPRTPNRVRFDIEDNESDTGDRMNGHTTRPQWMDEEDYLEGDEERALPRGEMQRMPLLTDIEAPIVTVASDFDPEDHLESARPRSNMRSAFMNMANSIM